ncbi:hypothetical protein [Azospirillum argentinense]
MATLPPHTPRWVIWLLNAVVLAALVGVGFLAKQFDWRYLFGFGAGYLFMAVSVRLKYGFWPFEDDH